MRRWRKRRWWRARMRSRARLLCFVALRTGHEPSKNLRSELMEFMANAIGSIARPADVVRRYCLRHAAALQQLLRELAMKGAVSGDTTTLEDIGGDRR